MVKNQKYFQPHQISKSLLLFFWLILSLCSMILALFYLSLNYDDLYNWYLNLNPYFYKVGTWHKDFFTLETKYYGDSISLLLLLINFSVMFWSTFQLKIHLKLFKEREIKLKINSIPWVWYVLVGLSAFILWFYGYSINYPGYDEAFSAINCAGIHPFQTISYYMLPNNHVFFNILNNICFNWSNDKIFTGRLISGFFYILTMLFAFDWINSLIKNKWIAFVSVLFVGAQFYIWGFGFQARGYEIYLFCHLMCIRTLLRYLHNQNSDFLLINSFFVITGFWTVPTFFYYFLIQCIVLLFHQFVKKKIDYVVYFYGLLTLIGIFLVYSPIILFSGFKALIGNKYVSPSTLSSPEYFKNVISLFPTFLNYTLSNNGLKWMLLPIIFAFLPFLLFLKKGSQIKWIAFIYLLVPISFLGFIYFLKAVPFHRNIIGLYFIMDTTIAITLFYIFKLIVNKTNQKWILTIFYPAGLLVLTYFMLNKDRQIVNDCLYYNSAKYDYEYTNLNIDKIPKNATIGFGNESFYWRYNCFRRKMNIDPKNPYTGHEDYLIIQKGESFKDSTRYVQFYRDDFYFIFKNKSVK